MSYICVLVLLRISYNNLKTFTDYKRPRDSCSVYLKGIFTQSVRSPKETGRTMTAMSIHIKVTYYNV